MNASRFISLLLPIVISCSAFAQSGSGGKSNGIGDIVGPGTRGVKAFQDFTRSTPAPGQALPIQGAAPCAASTLNWTVGGNTCTASAPAAIHQATSGALVDNVAPTRGNATFTCLNGTYSENAGSTCVAAADCNAGSAVSWSANGNTCNGTTSTTVSSGSTTPSVTDSTAPSTGSAQFICNNGSLTPTGTVTCNVPDPCASQTVTWTVGGRSCSTTAPGSANGAVTALLNSTNGNTGSARFTCSAGIYSQTPAQASASSCSSPPANCPGGGAISWTVGSNTCNGFTSASADGGNISVSDSSAPTTGTATYTCSNGSFVQTSANCSAPPPGSCPSGSLLSWFSGGNACEGITTAAPNGGTITLNDNSAPGVGSANYSCSNGTFVLGASTCGTGATPANCPSQTVVWSVSGNSCATTIAATPDGATTGVSSSNGNNGNADFTCNNGSFTRGFATCTPPAGATNCAAGQTLHWSTGGSSCSAVSTTVASGSSQSFTDSTGPTTGTASYFCSNGTLSLQSSNCATAATNCAAGQPLSWTTGSNTCNATSTSVNNGSSQSFTDSTSPTTGTALFSCNNGVFSQTSGSCNGAPAVTCNYAGGTVPWLDCSADPGPVSRNVGGTVTLTDSTGPFTGSITATCQSDGMFGFSNASCTNSAPAASNCSSQALTWSASGQTCSGSAPATSNGLTASVNSTNGNNGSANFTCSNGSFTQGPGASCAAVGPARVLGPIYGGFDNTIVDFQNGLDDLFYLYTLEIYSNGPSAAPTIRYAAGHAREGGGSPYNLGRPAYQVELSTVEPAKIRNVTLPLSVGSPMILGDSDLDSGFGPLRAYVVSGGCSGTSCTYSFMFHAIPPGSTQGSGRQVYLTQPNAFTTTCPSNGVYGFDFQGDPIGSQISYTSLEEQTVPGASQCFSRAGEQGSQDVNGNLVCPPGYYQNNSYLTCHPPVGAMGPRLITQRWIRTVSFTR